MFDFHIKQMNIPAALVEKVISVIVNFQGAIMQTQAQLAASLTALAVQTDKAKAEIIAKLGTLQAALDAAGNTSPEVDDAMAALTTAVQGVDDIEPDAPPA